MEAGAGVGVSNAASASESMWTADLSAADVAELLTSREQAVAGP
jgi:hypothetical protein